MQMSRGLVVAGAAVAGDSMLWARRALGELTVGSAGRHSVSKTACCQTKEVWAALFNKKFGILPFPPTSETLKQIFRAHTIFSSGAGLRYGHAFLYCHVAVMDPRLGHPLSPCVCSWGDASGAADGTRAGRALFLASATLQL